MYGWGGYGVWRVGRAVGHSAKKTHAKDAKAREVKHEHRADSAAYARLLELEALAPVELSPPFDPVAHREAFLNRVACDMLEAELATIDAPRRYRAPVRRVPVVTAPVPAPTAPPAPRARATTPKAIPVKIKPAASRRVCRHPARFGPSRCKNCPRRG